MKNGKKYDMAEAKGNSPEGNEQFNASPHARKHGANVG